MIHNPLKPCPFCGSTDVENDHTGPWWVTCQTCGCDGPTAPTEAESAEAWNAALRHEPPAAPTPLPAPALGMRVWTVGGGDGETWLREPVTINYVRPGATWSDYVKFVDEIALITNYCKGDIVLWERQ